MNKLMVSVVSLSLLGGVAFAEGKGKEKTPAAEKMPAGDKGVYGKGSIGTLTKTDVASIQSLDSTYNAALRTGDLEKAINTIYAEDVVLIPGDAKPMKGRKAVIEHLKTLGAKDWDHRNVSVVGNGDLAYQVSEWSLTANIQGKPTNVSGTCVDILRRQADGKWVITVETYTVLPAGQTSDLKTLLSLAQ